MADRAVADRKQPEEDTLDRGVDRDAIPVRPPRRTATHGATRFEITYQFSTGGSRVLSQALAPPPLRLRSRSAHRRFQRSGDAGGTAHTNRGCPSPRIRGGVVYPLIRSPSDVEPPLPMTAYVMLAAAAGEESLACK